MIAVVAVAEGNTTVKSPAVAVLSEPKSNTQTDGFVSGVPSSAAADGVEL